MRIPALVTAVLLAGCAGTPPPAPEATLGKGSGEMKSVIQRAVADPGRRLTSPQEWQPIAKAQADVLQSTVAVSAGGQPIPAATAFMGGSAVALGLATAESIDAIKSRIRSVVKDSSRSRAAQQAVERWRDGAGDYFKASKADHDAIVALVNRHDATRAEFDAVNRRMDERDARVVLDFIAGRESLRKQLTREEWSALFRETPR